MRQTTIDTIEKIISGITLIMWAAGLCCIVLKLTSVIDWHWLLVLSPIIGSFLFLILILLISKIGLWICLKLITRKKK